MDGAPRIYDLFPLLAGSLDRWEAHLPRIAAMGFDWVYLNPVTYPGYSGSLYAVKDYDRLHDLVRIPGDPRPDPEQLRGFLDAAHAHGLKVMMDLVINHTAFDSVLAGRHPEWYRHNPDGSLESPGCLDGDTWITWGDLARLDHLGSPDREGLWAFLTDLLVRMVELGFDGFRCDAAYHVPYPLWEHLIGAVRAWAGPRGRQVAFFGETLGCKAVDVVNVAASGFDFVFNSAKWWDLVSPWFLRDFRRTLGCAPSIAFPESHDTPRYAEEVDGDEGRVRQKYLACALLASGVLVPIGFEYGFRRALDVVHTRPEHWEEPSFDLTGFIRQVHDLKGAHRCFREDGDLFALETGDPKVAALVKTTADKRDRALLLFNTDPRDWREVTLADLADQVGCAWLEDVSIGHRCAPVGETDTFRYRLAPAESKVLVGHRTALERAAHPAVWSR